MKSLKQSEGTELKRMVETKVKEVLEEFTGLPLHQRVLASSIEHTPLYPSGDAIQIVLRVEIHERPKSNQEPN